MDLSERGRGYMDCINLAQVKDLGHSSESLEFRNFWTGWETSSFSKYILLHGACFFVLFHVWFP
jgi:hypothetical protein